MQYRPYGNTGLTVSALGFGAMRLPSLPSGVCDYDQSVPMLQHGIDLGINYIDTAWGYIGGTSEVAVGKAVKAYDREKLVISSKIPISGLNGYQYRKERLDVQLQRLDMDYVDIMHFHNMSWEVWQENALGEDGCLAAARKAQQEGLIRHIAFSSHDTPANVEKLVATGEFDGITLQYNFLDRRMEKAIQMANAQGMGTVIMGPVGGGRLSMWDPGELRDMIPGSVTSAPDIAIRWVLSNPTVTVALSGMNTMEMIDENIASASRETPFSAAELEAVDGMLTKLNAFSDLYCTGCGYCMPCPNGLDIPGNFLLMTYHQVYGMRDYAKAQYARMANGDRVWLQGTTISGKIASECIRCGECEPKCPQNIPIMDQLEEVAATLGA